MAWRPDAERGNRHQRGYGARWEKLRLRILRRDNYLCQCEECAGHGRVTPASEVDHITPKAKGGTDDPDNLRAINHECHKRKTAREASGDTLKGCDVNGWPLDPVHHWKG